MQASSNKLEHDDCTDLMLGPTADRDGMQLDATDSAHQSAAGGTMVERAYARLSYALIVGQVVPGECLTIRKLAVQLGSSITPVRDALSRLAAADALDHSRRSGVIVPLLSADELAELIRLRRAVEPVAFAEAAAFHAATNWRGVEAIHHDVCRLVEYEDAARFAAAIWSIRKTVLGLERMSILAGFITQIWCRLGPTFTQMMVDHNKRRCLASHFHTIVAAIGRGDVKRAAQAVIEEIEGCVTHCCNAVVDQPNASGRAATSVRACCMASPCLEIGADHV